jgi:hypothetical protein
VIDGGPDAALTDAVSSVIARLVSDGVQVLLLDAPWSGSLVNGKGRNPA